MPVKVLVVDDSASVCEFFSTLLDEIGHTVMTFGDAESALESCKSVQYDLALLDWMLPGMSGLDICRHIRSLPWGNRCVILVITARHKTEDLYEVLNAGADDYIMKPVNEILFMTRIRIAETALRRKCKIQETTHALEMAREQLEEKVLERTHELEQVNKLLTDSLHLKTILLSEIHHRVKNNMAIISSMLSLQSKHIEDRKFLDMLMEIRNRIHSMALVHEMLYRSRNLTDIGVKEYIDSLVGYISANYHKNRDIIISTEVEDMALSIDLLIPLGLIINELMMNTFKHAFHNQAEPKVTLSLIRDADERLALSVSDNGEGFRHGFDIDQSDGLGLKLLRALIGQIAGKLEISSGNGANFKITFPGTIELSRKLPAVI
jgi:two-component sensor histidine kinase